MERKLNCWELALLLGLLVTLCTGAWLGREQEELAGQVIRLHVIANSDSREDQALKLEVRDRILERAQELYPEHATLAKARAALEESLPELSRIGEQTVKEAGYDYPVTAQLTQCWFPTKEYEDFALPAGEYTALRIVIGEGEGQNWWCVAFPPLCLGAASQSVEEAAQAGYFDADQTALITGASEGYVLKFKGMELLGELKQFLAG